MALIIDRKAAAELPQVTGVKRFFVPTKELLEYRNIFVSVSLTGLSGMAGFIREANNRHHLRAVFVLDEWRSNMLPQFLYQANLRALRSLMVHTEWSLPARVLNAYRIGAEHELIAEAELIEDRLLVMNCAGERFDVPLCKFPPVGDLPPDERRDIEVEDDGSYIRWPSADIDLDLETIRTILDPSLLEKKRTERLLSDQRLGRAVAYLRHRSGLRQSDIPGMSDRQVRRIESGQRASAASLESLADAHGMSVRRYLDQLAEAAGSIR